MRPEVACSHGAASVQISVMVTPHLRAWIDSFRRQPPILGLDACGTERCLGLPCDTVDAVDVRTVRQLAATMSAFADQLDALHHTQRAARDGVASK